MSDGTHYHNDGAGVIDRTTEAVTGHHTSGQQQTPAYAGTGANNFASSADNYTTTQGSGANQGGLTTNAQSLHSSGGGDGYSEFNRGTHAHGSGLHPGTTGETTSTTTTTSGLSSGRNTGYTGQSTGQTGATTGTYTNQIGNTLHSGQHGYGAAPAGQLNSGLHAGEVNSAVTGGGGVVSHPSHQDPNAKESFGDKIKDVLGLGQAPQESNDSTSRGTTRGSSALEHDHDYGRAGTGLGGHQHGGDTTTSHGTHTGRDALVGGAVGAEGAHLANEHRGHGDQHYHRGPNDREVLHEETGSSGHHGHHHGHSATSGSNQDYSTSGTQARGNPVAGFGSSNTGAQSTTHHTGRDAAIGAGVGAEGAHLANKHHDNQTSGGNTSSSTGSHGIGSGGKTGGKDYSELPVYEEERLRKLEGEKGLGGGAGTGAGVR